MLERLLNLLQGGIQPLPLLTTGGPARVVALLDIFLVAAVVYATVRFLRRTRATHMLWSLLVIVLAIAAARFLGLPTLNAVLTLFAVLLAVALPVIFHPELRRGLERLGRALPLQGGSRALLDEVVLTELVTAVEALRARRWGATFVLERRTTLAEHADTGTPIGAEVRAPLLEAILTPASPLSDGAVIIRDRTVLAAGCTLPLAEDRGSRPRGTQHRAALGITEVSDAVAVAVSEGGGDISVMADGGVLTLARAADLRTVLSKLLREERTPRPHRAGPRSPRPETLTRHETAP